MLGEKINTTQKNTLASSAERLDTIQHPGAFILLYFAMQSRDRNLFGLIGVRVKLNFKRPFSKKGGSTSKTGDGKKVGTAGANEWK